MSGNGFGVSGDGDDPNLLSGVTSAGIFLTVGDFIFVIVVGFLGAWGRQRIAWIAVAIDDFAHDDGLNGLPVAPIFFFLLFFSLPRLRRFA